MGGESGIRPGDEPLNSSNSKAFHLDLRPTAPCSTGLTQCCDGWPGRVAHNPRAEAGALARGNSEPLPLPFSFSISVYLSRSGVGEVENPAPGFSNACGQPLVKRRDTPRSGCPQAGIVHTSWATAPMVVRNSRDDTDLSSYLTDVSINSSDDTDLTNGLRPGRCSTHSSYCSSTPESSSNSHSKTISVPPKGNSTSSGVQGTPTELARPEIPSSMSR